MAKSDLQFAGEFLITQCKLLTTSGNEYDIRNLVQNINICRLTDNDIFHKEKETKHKIL